MLINFISFQLGWFACVLGAAHHLPWLGPVAAVPIVGWHIYQAQDRPRELRLLLITACIGVVFDQGLLWTGLLSFTSGIWGYQFLPLWMISLWLLFCSTLNLSLRWLHGRSLTAALLGAVSGPLAYVAGAALGAISIRNNELLLAALALGWAVLLPCFIWLASRQASSHRLGLHHV